VTWFGPRATVAGMVVLGKAMTLAAAPQLFVLTARLAIAGEAPVSIPDSKALGNPTLGNPKTLGNPLWGIQIEKLAATRQRPLFSASRRPAQPPPPVVAPIAEELSELSQSPNLMRLTLIGTVDGSGVALAVVFDPAVQMYIRLKVGDRHNGWTLRAVHGREAILQRDRDMTILVLSEPDARQAANATMPALANLPGSVPTHSAYYRDE
jgi:hypothetical protein